MPSVVIVDYGSGNLHSASKAVERAARESGSATSVIVSSDPAAVERADRIILPGVGAFADCKAGLVAIAGMVEALEAAVLERARPFLGICVGMQLLADRGHEHRVTEGLGWIGGEVRRIMPADAALKVPHMGWNTLDVVQQHVLLDGIPTGPTGWHAYFVHSYHLTGLERDRLLAVTDYGGPITAMVGRENIVGTQFHPEKSQQLGLRLLANFLGWSP
ncbi:MAG: imidazole glycerol phosphate synthase subunit HisH [Hyphomicrobiaceae bacterium]